ncbi:hypothetical protein BDF22DRAFT_778991 [Syncephalis plumigaleata]|nr:hypothetical protein BDF22DRAFT_778991 [Syncephalis plumigaleata]
MQSIDADEYAIGQLDESTLTETAPPPPYSHLSSNNTSNMSAQYTNVPQVITSPVDASMMIQRVVEQAMQMNATFNDTTQAVHMAIHNTRWAVQLINSDDPSNTSNANEQAALAMNTAMQALENSLHTISIFNATLAAMDTARIAMMNAAPSTLTVLVDNEDDSYDNTTNLSDETAIDQMDTISHHSHSHSVEHTLVDQSDQTYPINDNIKSLQQRITIDESSTRAQVQLFNREIPYLTTGHPIDKQMCHDQRKLRRQFAIEQIYTHLFDLLWSKVPITYRRKGFPTESPFPLWNITSLRRYIFNLRILDDSVISWSDYYSRYFTNETTLQPNPSNPTSL